MLNCSSHQVSYPPCPDVCGYKVRDRGFRRRTRQYVEKSDGAHRSGHARIRCRNGKLVIVEAWVSMSYAGSN